MLALCIQSTSLHLQLRCAMPCLPVAKLVKSIVNFDAAPQLQMASSCGHTVVRQLGSWQICNLCM